MQLTWLVLPAPFGPMMATSSRSPTWRLMSESAYTPPKRRERWSIDRRFAPPSGRFIGSCLVNVSRRRVARQLFDLGGDERRGRFRFTIPRDATIAEEPLRRARSPIRFLRCVVFGAPPHR